MVEPKKNNSILAAVAGAVVGAGAVIAGAIALSDKNNQKKVGNFIDKAKNLVKGVSEEVEDKKKDVKLNIKKIVKKEINKI